MFDRQYTLVAHPRVRARLSYRTDDGDLTAATVELDYRSDGEWTEAGPAVDLPEPPEDAGVGWQGLDIAVYRDGEKLFARETASSLVSEATSLVDAAERYAPRAVRRGKRVARMAAERAANRGRVQMTQVDGSTVEALAPPAQAAFELYEETNGEWRWRLVHDNGNVIADSGEGYASKEGARRGVRSVKRNALGAAVEPVGGEAERDARSDEESGAESGAA